MEQKAALITKLESSGEDNFMAKFWATQKKLAKIQTAEDAVRFRRNSKALESLSKHYQLSKELQNEVTELRIRAERKLGEILLSMEKAKFSLGNQYTGKLADDSSSILTLSDMGVTKNESSRFQRIAKINEFIFEEVLTDLKKECSLSTAKVLRAAQEKQRTDKEPEFSSIIKPSDNWNFASIKYGRIDDGMEEDWGYIPGELYANCFWYYVNPGDLVVAPMAGAGQCQRVYDARSEWMGKHIFDFDLRMFDLNPRGKYKDLISQHNLVESFPPVENPNYIVMDVPYYGMVNNQYSNKSEDLANMTLEDWQISMNKIAQNCAGSQQPKALCTVISPNYSDVSNCRYILTTRLILEMWEGAGYILHHETFSSRRVQQTQSFDAARLNNQAKRNRTMLTDITKIMTFIKA